jgi:hypothetical protein
MKPGPLRMLVARFRRFREARLHGAARFLLGTIIERMHMQRMTVFDCR